MTQDSKQNTRINPAIHLACKQLAKQNNTPLYHFVERALIKHWILPKDPDLAKKLADGLEEARCLAKSGPVDKTKREKLPPRKSVDEIIGTIEESQRDDILGNIAGDQKVIAVNNGVMEYVISSAKAMDRYGFELVEDTLIANILTPLDPKLAEQIRDTIHEARVRKKMRSGKFAKNEPPMRDDYDTPLSEDYPEDTIRLLVVTAEEKQQLCVSHADVKAVGPSR